MNNFADAPPLIRGENLVAGVYCCGLAGGAIEYGYSFHKPDPNDLTGEPQEDVEFDVVLGVVPPKAPAADIDTTIADAVAKYRWVAEAIVKAAPKEEA